MSAPILVLPEGFDEFEWELESKGWFGGAHLLFGDRQVPVEFFDQTRLNQEISDALETSNCALFKNLIVVPVVTRRAMFAAVLSLVESGEIDAFR
jgi:hypothetical protein